MVRHEMKQASDFLSEMEEQGSVLAMDVDEEVETIDLFNDSFLSPENTKLVDRDFFNSFEDDFDDADIN